MEEGKVDEKEDERIIGYSGEIKNVYKFLAPKMFSMFSFHVNRIRLHPRATDIILFNKFPMVSLATPRPDANVHHQQVT